MRKLEFDAECGTERFEVLYDGLLQTPRGFKAPTETRVIGSVLTKLEKIGKTVTIPGPNGQDFSTYRLLTRGVAIKLEEAEYNLLVESLKPIQWRIAGARIATKAMEWLESVKEFTDNAEAHT